MASNGESPNMSTSSGNGCVSKSLPLLKHTEDSARGLNEVPDRKCPTRSPPSMRPAGRSSNDRFVAYNRAYRSVSETSHTIEENGDQCSENQPRSIEIERDS